jgi:hypothetical protein
VPSDGKPFWRRPRVVTVLVVVTLLLVVIPWLMSNTLRG